jgi:hypothetical protein
MINFTDIFLYVRETYQIHFNSKIISLIIPSKSITSPLYNPFYLYYLNLFPYFIIKKFFNLSEIKYLYSCDNLIKISNDTKTTLLPIILDCTIYQNIVKEPFTKFKSITSTSFNLKQVLNKYSSNIPIDYIVKNEYIKYNSNIKNSLLKNIINSNNLIIEINYFKNSKKQNITLNYNDYKYNSIHKILNL